MKRLFYKHNKSDNIEIYKGKDWNGYKNIILPVETCYDIMYFEDLYKVYQEIMKDLVKGQDKKKYCEQLKILRGKRK